MVNTVMTVRTDRDQVVRSVRAFGPWNNVMYLERNVSRSAADLAFVSVAVKDVFSNVEKVLHWPVLIVFSFYIRIFDLLNIEGARLDDDLRDRKDRKHELNGTQPLGLEAFLLLKRAFR